MSEHPLVGVVMGSDSDLEVMQGAVDVLDDFGIPREVRVTSAHRTPERMLAYGKEAAGRIGEVHGALGVKGPDRMAWEHGKIERTLVYLYSQSV